jgi:hypothetical protein
MPTTMRARRMEISFAAMLAWVVPFGLAAGLIGAAPTYLAGGADALRAELAAGAIVMAAVALSGMIVTASAWSGPAKASMAFLASGLLRLGVSVALGLLVQRWLGVPAAALFVWLGVFYLAMFLAESLWLTRALRRDADRLSLGEVKRPNRHLWNRHRIR